MTPSTFIEKCFFAVMPLATGALAFSLGVTFFYPQQHISQVQPIGTAYAPHGVTVPVSFNNFSNDFSHDITARAAVVYDIHEKKILFAKDAERPFPLASITKLMTALVAYDILPHEKRIALPSENTEGVEETRLLLPDALAYLLVGSKNGEAERVALAASIALKERASSVATVALSSPSSTSSLELFTKKMNERARVLGMNQTRFYNSTGLDESDTEGGAYGSAHDVALLLAHLTAQSDLPFLEATSRPRFSARAESGVFVTTENTNKIIGAIPGLMISKTGFTDLAGGNLAVVFDAGLNHPVAVVVLGSTLEGRFTDTQALVEETLKLIEKGL